MGQGGLGCDEGGGWDVMSSRVLNSPQDERRDSGRPVKDHVSMVLDRLSLLATRKDDMWWEIGCALDEVAVRGFYASLGFGDWLSFAQEHVGLSCDEAISFRRVARFFSRETAVRFGVGKLELLLQYLERCPSSEPVVDLLRVKIAVHLEGEQVLVPFVNITHEQLVQALQEVACGCSCYATDVPTDVLTELEWTHEAMCRDGLGQVVVKVHHSIGQHDSYSLVISGVEPCNMAEVGRVLMERGLGREGGTGRRE